MNAIQKWLMVAISGILAVGVLMNAFHDRYKLPKLFEQYQYDNPDARYDTWTGELEVKRLRNGKWVYEIGSTSWVESLK